MFDYFYGQSGEMFSYFRVPKILFRDIRFKDLSTDAKTLYGILLDRMSLSVKNGWLDGQGRVYIIFPVQEVMDALGCADNKATKLFRELEKFGLIERKRRGLGKPNLIYSEEDNPLALKADFILSLCELVVGGKEGLLPVEKTVIDRCVHLIYRKYFADPTPENMPLLEDLYNALLQQDEKEAHHVAAALEIYVKGSLNVFNHRTNVDINNRIVCFDIKQLGKQLKKLGMLIVQDAV